MKIVRIAGISLAVLLGLAAAGIGLLYALFDGDKLQTEIARSVSESTGRRLDIAGPLELSVWPELGLRLGKASLSEPRSSEGFASLESARIAVAVMPLLSRQVKVRRIELAGFTATLVRHRDGRLNIDDLIGGGARDRQAPAGQGPGDAAARPPLQFEIEGLRITNARLAWRDDKTGSTATLSDLDIGSGRIRAEGAAGSVSIDALALAARGKAGAESFELRLDAPSLRVSPETSAAETVSLAATLSGVQRRVAAKIRLGGVEGKPASLRIARLEFELDASSGDAAVRGQLASPVAADLAARSLVLEQLAGKLEFAHPKMPVRPLVMPLKGRLRADLAQQAAAVDLATAFDESKIALKLEVAKFAPLALGFDLEVDRLNVDKYLPPAAPAPGAGAPPPAPAAEGRLDFSVLKGHDVRGAVRIGSLQVARLRLAGLDAKLRLAGGRLEVAPISARLYEGSAAGSLMLDAAGNQVALKQNLSGIRIHPLLQDLADKDLLDGRGNVAVDLASRGDSVAAMKKGLAGTASLNLKDGAVKGFNLARALRDIKGKLGSRQDSTQPGHAGDRTDFSELAASLKIAGGLARNDDLAMKSPFLRLAGAGDIDIGEGRMDYLARASVVKDATGQGGQDLEHLKGLTVPVRIRGPFDKLSYTLELGGLVADAAKARVEEKKEEIKARAQDQLKDKLKGLFGR